MSDFIYRKNITKAINSWFDKDSSRKNTDLANHFNVSEMTASRWHKGTHIPDVDLLPELARFLGISLSELFGIEDSNGLSDEEAEIILSYRNNPDMRDAVKKLLGVKR